MPEHEKLDYVEFATRDITATKKFFQVAFGWEFQDYGPEYSAFTKQGLDGGFFQSDSCSTTNLGGALLVFYSEDLEGTLAKVLEAGASLAKPIFSFPGGRRFQFIEPGGNEFGVWASPQI